MVSRIIASSVFIVSLWLSPIFVHAQPAMQWAKCYGSASHELAKSIAIAWDGGYVVGGNSDSCQNGVAPDFWIVKTDDSGNVDWKKCYGGSGSELAFFMTRVQSETDSGYLMVGNTNSNDGDVTGNHGIMDIWAIRTDVHGNLLWQKALGGTSIDYGLGARGTPDGGCVIVGETWSNDGDVSGYHGNTDMWVVRLDSAGNILWQKCLGGTGFEDGRRVDLTHDGGFVIAGRASSLDGDVSNLIGGLDYWVVKLSGNGSLVWEKTYGSAGSDFAFSISRTKDDGFVVAGWSFYDPKANGNYESILKIDKHGVQQWTAPPSITFDAIETSGNGYVTISGEGGDYNINKLSDTGGTVWTKSMGGSGLEQPWAIIEAKDGGSVIAGTTESNCGDVTGYHGGGDMWVVKLAPDPTSVSHSIETKETLLLYPNPSDGIFTINFDAKKDLKGLRISISNIVGVVILQEEFKRVDGKFVRQIDFSNMPRGMYFVELAVEGKKIKKKMIIQ